MTGRRLRIFAYTVEGSGAFPFDMLRYDEAWPAFEGAVAHLFDGHATELRRLATGETNRARRRVELRGLSLPTDDRWASFGWKVLRESGPDRSPREVSF